MKTSDEIEFVTATDSNEKRGNQFASGKRCATYYKHLKEMWALLKK